MKRFVLITGLGAALLLTAALLPGATASATHPATPQPLIYCADVNGDASVSVGDIGFVVGKFGTFSADYTIVPGGYHPLYDLITSSGGGSISVGDVGAVVTDFGNNPNGGCPSAVDTQIAAATQWVLTSHPALLTESVSTLNGLGYQQAAGDVPGQGVHYISQANWDSTFAPTAPEGLVYNNGELVAQLYYVDGWVVGWGTEPPPVEQVNIDAFCAPAPCSWSGTGDGWHWHANLCRTNIGTAQAQLTITATPEACEAIHNSNGGQGTWIWQARVGWMGHVWSHMLNPNQNPDDGNNGRFADCFPDAQHFGPYTCF